MIQGLLESDVPKSCENLSSSWKNSSQTPNLLPIFVQVYPLGAYNFVNIYPTSPRKSDFYQQALKVLPIFPPQWLTRVSRHSCSSNGQPGSVWFAWTRRRARIGCRKAESFFYLRVHQPSLLQGVIPMCFQEYCASPAPFDFPRKNAQDRPPHP